MMAKRSSKTRPLPFAALFLAWLIPGAGHVYLARPWRGVVVFLVVGATFWAGVAIGGVMTVDYQNQRWWFAAEMLTGLHGLIGWWRQDKVYRELTADSEVGIPPPRRTQRRQRWEYRLDARLAKDKIALVSPTDTVARAYAGVAGLLNLMCVFDAAMLALSGVSGEQPPKVPREAEARESK